MEENKERHVMFFQIEAKEKKGGGRLKDRGNKYLIDTSQTEKE